MSCRKGEEELFVAEIVCFGFLPLGIDNALQASYEVVRGDRMRGRTFEVRLSFDGRRLELMWNSFFFFFFIGKKKIGYRFGSFF